MRTNWNLAVVSFAAGLSIASVVSAQASFPLVIVGNNVGDNVTTYELLPTGALSRIGTFAVGDGPQAIHLSPDGRFLAVGHGTASTTTEELRILRVNPNGTLTPLLTTSVPDSPLAVRWLRDNTLAVTKTGSPANVQMFTWNEGSNQLTSVGTWSTGSFNSRLASARNGTLLYANDSTGNAIRTFDVNAGGTLSPVQTLSTSPWFAVDMTVSNDERFLYGYGGISGDGRRIIGYTIGADGSLSPMAPNDSFTSPGQSPKVGRMSADGRFLFVGHGTDATFWSFAVDPVTGALTSTGFNYDVGLQGTLGDMAVLGDYLLVTDNSSAIDGRTGVLSFRINSDGSFTEIGLFDSFGARPDYLAVWVPEPGAALLLAAAGLGALLRRRARRR